MAAPSSLVKLLIPALYSGWTSIQKWTNASRAEENMLTIWWLSLS